MLDDGDGILAPVSGVVLGCLIAGAMPMYGVTLVGVCGYMLLSKIFKNHRFRRLFKELNLDADLLGEKNENGSTVYRFSVPVGKGLEDFEKNKGRIEAYLGRRIAFDCANRNIFMEVYDGMMEHFDFEFRKHKGITVELGRKRNGEVLLLDMQDSPSLLIGGEPGSGKSVLLRSLLCQLILKGNTKLYLIDLKGGVEFAVFRKSKAVAGFGRVKSEAPRIIQEVREEIDRRYKQFYDNDQVNIKDSKMGYVVLVIDEFAELMNDKDSKEGLYDIAARGRACGVYCIISTQRPDAKVLDGLLKACIVNTAGLKTRSRINSEIVIGEGGLEFLSGQGHGIFMPGKIEFQAPFLTVEKTKELIQHTYVEKKDNVIPYEGFKC